MSLKNFNFLLPHLSQFEGELKDLLIEIDNLMEKKKFEWKSELNSLECKLSKKIEENQLLQEKIRSKETELHAASSKLHAIESKLVADNRSSEPKSPKSTVDLMNSSLKKLHSKYHKLMLAENEKNSVTLRKIEEHNAALVVELKKSKEDSHKRIEDLTNHLQREKLYNEELQAQCSQLRNELNMKCNELEKERSKNMELQSAFYERQVKFDSLLRNANLTSELQTSELRRLRLLLESKQVELRRLSSEASLKKVALTLSENAVARLEPAVARPASVHSNSKSPHNIPSSGNSSDPNAAQVSRSPTRAELDKKLRDLEHQLCDSHVLIRQKMEEISQLEHACHTAAATIHRLIESKTLNEQRISFLKVSINGTITTTRSLSVRVKRLENTLLHKMSSLKTRLEKLMLHVSRLHKYSMAHRNRPSFCSVGVQEVPATVHIALQTCPDFTLSLAKSTSVTDLPADVRASSIENLRHEINSLAEERTSLKSKLTHQNECIERLQRENVLLSALLSTTGRCIEISKPSTGRPSSPSASNKTEVTQQLCVLPENSPVSIAVETPDEEIPELAVSPFDSFRPVPATDAATIMDIVSSGYHSARDLPVDSHTITYVDADGLAEEPSAFTESFVPFSTPNFSGALQIADNQTAIAESDCVHFQLSPLSLSPSEYGELPAPKLAFPRATMPSLPDLSLHPCPNPTELKDITYSQWIPPTCIATQSIAGATFDTTCNQLNAFTSSSAHTSHTNKSNVRIEQLDRCSDTVVPQRAGSVSPNHLVDVNHFAPRIHSTARKISHNAAQFAYSDADEDTSVYCLAAKFLANEQEYSLRLEEQIDSHLETLKNQIGLCSTIQI